MDINRAAEIFIISKYDAINDNVCNRIDFEIGKTKFVISKEDDDVTINYISSVNVDVTFNCTRREDFENFVSGMFN